jgi:Cu+-exporting ATPase
VKETGVVIRSQEIVIDVKGMTSAACERRVSDALSAVPGVAAARASRAEGQAVVTADPMKATPEKLRAAVEDAGYEPGEMRFPE